MSERPTSRYNPYYNPDTGGYDPNYDDTPRDTTNYRDDELPIIRGCRDPRAVNYDPRATVDGEQCIMPGDEEDPTPVDTTTTPTIATVNVIVKSVPRGAGIFVDGMDMSKKTPSTLQFNSKELLTPKIFTAKMNGNVATKMYRIKTTVRPYTRTGIFDTQYFINLVNPKYDLQVEELIDGRWSIIPRSDGFINFLTDISHRFVTIDFDMTDFIIEPDDVVVEDEDDTPVDNIPVLQKHKVEIRGDVSSNEIIRWTVTTSGETGFVKDGDDNIKELTVFTIDGINAPSIKFERVNITPLTHRVRFTIQQPGDNMQSVFEDDFTIELLQGKTLINVEANKLVEVPSMEKPVVVVDNDVLRFNTNNPKAPAVIRYSSLNSDRVIFKMGNKTRTLKANGYIQLTATDFTNGLGQYTVYLQPKSNVNGTGDAKRVIINVINEYFLPGPDITHITYPENIKGADFKGYNEDFKISWQSINTNYVEVYVNKKDDKFALAKTTANGSLTLNVADVLRKGLKQFGTNTDKIRFDLVLIPYNEEGQTLESGKEEKISILFDKGDLRLRRAQVVSDIRRAFESELNRETLTEETSRYLTHYVHFGDGDNKLIASWAIDRETFSEYEENLSDSQIRKVKEVKTLVLKLYEPLSNGIQPNTQLWMSKLQSIPIISQVTLNDNDITECVVLTPNFQLDIGDDIGYQILDDLVASGSVSSTQLTEQFIGSNQFSLAPLNLKYIDETDYLWDNFVKYSSASERVENFFYKVKAIEYHEATLDAMPTGSVSSSVSVALEITRVNESITNIKRGFDAFENLLYTTSGSLTYPGAGYTELSGSTSSEAESWYTGIIASATSYDEDNTNALVNNIPLHIKNDEEGQDYVMFFNMIGQHFDVVSSYTQGILDGKKLTHNNNDGITNELIYHMLESLGWDADMGVKSQYLWEYAFGTNKDGTSSSSMNGKERQLEIWRRLLNNLPYLYKYKGTKRALNAAMACYGVPSSMLTVMEFGGPVDTTTDGTTSFTFDDRTAALDFTGTEYLEVGWKAYQSGSIVDNTFGSQWPNTLEIRLNTESRTTQTIFQAEGFEVTLVPGTGSQASVQLEIDGGTYIATSSYFPMFNEDYTQIAVTRTLSGSNYVYEVFGKEGFNERIRNEGYGFVTVPTGSDTWYLVSTPLYVGGAPSTNGLIGTIDEFRLWSTPLEESRLENHALLPDAIDGNHVSASTEDLIFRNDFEYPKDRSSGGDTQIKNVSMNYGYEEDFATAVNFASVTEYPYQYIPYERTVTARVPASGISFSNKVRFESHTLENYLKFGSTSNVSTFDNAKDSNKLGLFFSPIKEVNLDIVKSLGQFNIDNYIGNPADDYTYDYKDLSALRNYYFDRFDLNIYEYIQLVRYIDQTIFTTLESLVPGRAKVSSGLLIEQHILERSKVQRTKPIAEDLDHEVTINADEDTNLFGTFDVLDADLEANRDIDLVVEASQLESVVDAGLDINLFGERANYVGTIVIEDDEEITAEYRTWETVIDASFTGSLVGEYDNTSYQQIGMDPDSIANKGFGILGYGGHVFRTYLDVFGHIQKERIQVYKLKIAKVIDVPENINPLDESEGKHYVPTTFYEYKITFLPYGSTAPSVIGEIVEVTPLNGYYPSHYRNVGDLSTGMQNSWYNGSKQTSATTLDGTPAVETFTTNPNTLLVNDSGRGSGEPILEVD